MSAPGSRSVVAKRCSLLRRRRDLTVDAFRDHWAGPHAAIARTMPGIARYTQNRIAEQLWAQHGAVPAFECDGIVELEFRDQRAMAEANASDAVRHLLPEDELRFLDGITLCAVPAGSRQTWPGMVKVMMAARLLDGIPADRLGDVLGTSGCIEQSVDPVSATFHRERLGHETQPPQFFATLWFDPRHELGATFAAESPWRRAAAACIGRGTVWRCDPLAIVG
jgi:hypothetical protein